MFGDRCVAMVIKVDVIVEKGPHLYKLKFNVNLI